MRFHKMYAHLLGPVEASLRQIHKILENKILRLSSVAKQKVHMMRLIKKRSLKSLLYGQTIDKDDEEAIRIKQQKGEIWIKAATRTRVQEDKDLTWMEKREIAKRFEYEDNLVNYDPDDELSIPFDLGTNKNGDLPDDKMEKINIEIARQNPGDRIKNKVLEDGHFTANGIVEINNDQWSLKKLMRDINSKIESISSGMLAEMNADDRLIFHHTIQDEEKKDGDYRIKDPQAIDSRFIYMMRAELASSHETPEQLEGILEKYIEDKEKERENKKYENDQKKILHKDIKVTKTNRLSEKQTYVIWKQFTYFQGTARHVKILEGLLSDLSFMETYTQ